MSMYRERNERFIPNIGRFAKSSAIPNSYFLNKSFYQEVLPNNAEVFLKEDSPSSESKEFKSLLMDAVLSELLPSGILLSVPLLSFISSKVTELRQRGLSKDSIIKVVKSNVRNKI